MFNSYSRQAQGIKYIQYSFSECKSDENANGRHVQIMVTKIKLSAQNTCDILNLLVGQTLSPKCKKDLSAVLLS